MYKAWARGWRGCGLGRPRRGGQLGRRWCGLTGRGILTSWRVSRRGALGPAGQGWEPLVTHNQPLISSYNQQQTTTQSLLLTADSDLRPATRDTCLNTTARTLVTRAVSGTGAEDNMKLELENNLTFVPGTAIVTCHVSRVTTPSLFMAHFPQLTLHTH